MKKDIDQNLSSQKLSKLLFPKMQLGKLIKFGNICKSTEFESFFLAFVFEETTSKTAVTDTY